MKTLGNDYELVTGVSRMQFDRVHQWLSGSYWSPGISLGTVQRAAENSSIVIGVFHRDLQVAYTRVVSDRTTFAWLCDVYVEESHRGNGLAKAMVKHALDLPDHQGLRRWLLATRDAHAIYTECGFQPLPMPERWMAKV